MDQKNTIVKCTASPNCLFNHNGICDNYVISIGADGSCQEYIETASEEDMKNGVIGEYKGLTLKERKTCHEDCAHFDDSDPMVGPVCLFKHPEPLKKFYEGMPCDYYHKRGQRANCNVYDYACDISFLKEDLEKIQQTLEQGSIPCTMKVAELNKPNKNKSTIRDVVPECDLPICDWSCKHALRSGPSFNPELWCDIMKQKPAVGLFCSDYEEEQPIIKINSPSEVTFTAENAQWDKEFIADQMCWYCDHGKHGKCKFPAKPMRDSNGECCRFTSTGGNR